MSSDIYLNGITYPADRKVAFPGKDGKPVVFSLPEDADKDLNPYSERPVQNKVIHAAIEDVRQRQTSPYNFKGAVATLADLPSTGQKVNDTYYVEALKYRVTWTGSAWQQSSMDESDYEDELGDIRQSIDDSQAVRPQVCGAYYTGKMANGSIASAQSVAAINNTNYIPVVPGQTVTCLISRAPKVEGDSYVFGYRVYNAGKTMIRDVDYGKTKTNPVVTVTDAAAAYIRYVISESNGTTYTNLRITDFADGDIRFRVEDPDSMRIRLAGMLPNIGFVPTDTDLDECRENARGVLATGRTYHGIPARLALPAEFSAAQYGGSLVVQHIYDYTNSIEYSRRYNGEAWSLWNSDWYALRNDTLRLVKHSRAEYGEVTGGGYWEEGTFVPSEEKYSWIIPTPALRFAVVYRARTLEYLDAEKAYVKTAETFSDDVAPVSEYGSSLSMQYHVYQLEGYPYVNIICEAGEEPPVYFADKKHLCFFAADDTEALDISFNGARILGPEETRDPGTAREYSIVLNGRINTNDTEYLHTGRMFFRRGAVLDTSDTAVLFRVVGFGRTKTVFTSVRQHYEFTEDMVCYVDYYVGSWNWSDFKPVISNADCLYFLRILTAEDRQKNPWKGRSWWAYGTSLTDIGSGDTAGNNGHSGKIPLSIEHLSEMVRYNGAIGTGGYTSYQPDNRYVTANVLETPYDADLVTMEIGPNDAFYEERKMGVIGDTTPETLCGAITTCIEYLTNHTRARVVLVFAGWRIKDLDWNGDTTEPVSPVNNAHHRAYRKMVDTLSELARLYGIPVIDANAEALEWGKRRTGLTYKDHIHPNYLGGEILGRYIWDKIRRIAPNPLDIPAEAE